MFEWDAAKAAANLAKHGIGFEQASRIFDGPVLTAADIRVDYGELREISIGVAEGSRVWLSFIRIAGAEHD